MSAIEVRSSTAVLIKGFTIIPSEENLEVGIYVYWNSYDCTVMDNVIANFSETISPRNRCGIRIGLGGAPIDGTWCTVRGNTITNNSYGIYCYKYDGDGNNIIYGNVITNNYYGVYCQHSTGNGNNIETAYGNDITNNNYGVYCFRSINNKFYHNNLIDNTYAAYPNGYVQVWDDGYPSGGNYWGDYGGTDSDGDFIGDTPYIIDENNQDNYPLMNKWFLGDVNHDGVVDILDAAKISAHWYPGPPIGPLGYNSVADLNYDGSVDILDLAIVSANWGKTVNP